VEFDVVRRLRTKWTVNFGEFIASPGYTVIQIKCELIRSRGK
jgi:hypothetical protein